MLLPMAGHAGERMHPVLCVNSPPVMLPLLCALLCAKITGFVPPGALLLVLAAVVVLGEPAAIANIL